MQLSCHGCSCSDWCRAVPLRCSMNPQTTAAEVHTIQIFMEKDLIDYDKCPEHCPADSPARSYSIILDLGSSLYALPNNLSCLVQSKYQRFSKYLRSNGKGLLGSRLWWGARRRCRSPGNPKICSAGSG